MRPRAPAWKGRYLPAATLRSMRAWLSLSIPILVAGGILAGCSQPLPNWTGRKAIDPPLAKLPRLESLAGRRHGDANFGTRWCR